MQNLNKPLTKQKGAVLILMAFIIGLGVLAYMLHAFDPTRLRLEQDKKTYETLNEAKQALIAWSVSHQYTPGQMPWPDRHLDPGIYDGSSDCATTAFQYSNLLGQLPSLPDTSPCLDRNTGLSVYAGLSTYPSLGQEFRDGQGNRLWYAVSRNLVRKYDAPASDPIINPNSINAPTYQWLQVLDRNGNLVSDRVAVVILASGDALPGQSRAGAADASQFLDGFQIGAAVFNNRGYATEDEDFIMGDDSRNVSPNDPTFVQPYNFNDKLVYITIDELMAALEKRVGEQVRTTLKTYQDTNGYYPYATQLGTTANLSCWQNAAGTDGLKEGLLPANYQSCSYARTTTLPNSSSLSCVNTIFNPAASLGITQIRFTRAGGSNFTTTTGGGACVLTTTTCTCTGAGSCSNATNNPRVTCTTSGCAATGTGSLGTFRTTGDKFTARSGGCAQTTFPNPSVVTGCATNNAVITCSASNGATASCGDVRFDNLLPAWFNQNQWGNFVYYRMTVPRLPPALAQLTVGARNSEAVLVTVGRPINTAPFAASKAAAQARPSCNALNNYLDSVESTNGDAVYDATSIQRNTSYNDQTFVVEP
jgi:hypothetical protein